MHVLLINNDFCEVYDTPELATSRKQILTSQGFKVRAWQGIGLNKANTDIKVPAGG